MNGTAGLNDDEVLPVFLTACAKQTSKISKSFFQSQDKIKKIIVTVHGILMFSCNLKLGNGRFCRGDPRG